MSIARPVWCPNQPTAVMRRATGVAVLCVTAGLLSACATVEDSVDSLSGALGFGSDQDQAERGPPPDTAVTYTVAVETTLDPALEEQVLNTSRLWEGREHWVASLLVLNQRAREDEREILPEALQSLGFYDGEVEVEVGETPAAGQPVPVAIAIEAGPRYTIAADSEVVVQPATAAFDPSAVVAPLFTGSEPADATRIRDAVTNVVAAAREQGYPFVELAEDRFVLNRQDDTLTVLLTLDLGPAARLGPLQIEGLETVNPSVVERQRTWATGEPYRPETLAEFRRRLIELDVFATVEAELVEPPPGSDPATPVPVRVVVSEDLPRTLSGEIAFDSDRGLFLGAGWVHRNLTGRADRFEVLGVTTGLIGGSDALGEGIDVGLDVAWTLPDQLAQDQDLKLLFSAEREATDAYDNRAVSLGATVTRRLDEDVTASLGVAASQSIVDTAELDGQSFSLLKVPGEVAVDTTDDLLDPTRGWRGRAQLQPTIGFGDQALALARTRLEGSTYWDANGDGDVILAGRAAVGTSLGTTGDLDALPPDLRFYAGGGGSVRGFAFQGIGPEQSDGTPRGGLSVAELNLEARLRVYEEIGIVPFVDLGYVSDTVFPSFDEGVAIGAGLGLRYHTSFGPIRLDVATPVTQRDDAPAVNVYISIGQAF